MFGGSGAEGSYGSYDGGGGGGGGSIGFFDKLQQGLESARETVDLGLQQGLDSIRKTEVAQKLKQTTKGTLESMLGGWGAGGGGGGMSGGGSSSAQHYDDSSAAAAAAAADVGYGPGGTRLTRDRGCRSRFSDADWAQRVKDRTVGFHGGAAGGARTASGRYVDDEVVLGPPRPLSHLDAVDRYEAKEHSFHFC